MTHHSRCSLALGAILGALGDRTAITGTGMVTIGHHRRSVVDGPYDDGLYITGSSQLSAEELAAGMEANARALPANLKHLGYARDHPDNGFQRSLPALAVTACLDFFVPVGSLLSTYYSVGFSKRDDANWHGLPPVTRMLKPALCNSTGTPHVAWLAPPDSLHTVQPAADKGERGVCGVGACVVQAGGVLQLLKCLLREMVVSDDASCLAIGTAWCVPQPVMERGRGV